MSGCKAQAKTGKLIVVYKTTFTPGAVSYTAGDAFQVVQSIPGATFTSEDSGFIRYIKVYDYLASGSIATPTINFTFATESFAGVADNAAMNFTGDAETLITAKGELQIAGTDYISADTTGGDAKAVAYKCFYSTDSIQFTNSDTSAIYFQMSLPDGESFTAGEEITIEIGVEQC